MHVLSGYDTTARGEILRLDFYGRDARRFPMAGHILPVIFSLHLNVRINNVAGAIEGLLDPARFGAPMRQALNARTDTSRPNGSSGLCGAADRRSSRDWNILVGGLQPQAIAPKLSVHLSARADPLRHQDVGLAEAVHVGQHADHGVAVLAIEGEGMAFGRG